VKEKSKLFFFHQRGKSQGLKALPGKKQSKFALELPVETLNYQE
jgi:hypothetical protein